MPPQTVNWAIYDALPLEEAKYQLSHVNETNVHQALVSHFICLPLAFIAISIRFLSRRIGRVALGSDDLMIFVALVRQYLRFTHHCCRYRIDKLSSRCLRLRTILRP